MFAPAPDATPSETDPIGRPPSRRGPTRRLVGLLILLCLPIVAGSLAFGVYRLHALQRLDRALALASQTDPGWNAPAVFRSGTPPARAEDDLVPLLRAVAAALGPRWNAPGQYAQFPPDRRRRYDLLRDANGPDHRHPLTAGLAAQVLGDLHALRPAPEEARRIAFIGNGFRIPPPGGPGPGWPRLGGALTQVDWDILAVEELLRADAVAQAEAGDPDLALVDLVALLKLTSYRTAYPTAGVTLYRYRLQLELVDLLGRVLSRGSPTERGLAPLAAALADQRAEGTLLATIRADRAGYDRALADLTEGKITPAQALVGGGSPLARYPIPRAVIESNRAHQLVMYNEAVELARLPARDRVRFYPAWVGRWWGGRFATDILSTQGQGLLLPLFEEAKRVEVWLDAARVAVAAERFRLAHGRPPGDVAELVPRYLDVAPADPFAEAGPLRLRENARGLAAYSLGTDGVDGGGEVVPRSPGRDARLFPPDWGLLVPHPDRRGLPDGAAPLPRDVFAREPVP
jgi:hypothetical protein